MNLQMEPQFIEYKNLSLDNQNQKKDYSNEGMCLTI
jgi:hypothetical protein